MKLGDVHLTAIIKKDDHARGRWMYRSMIRCGYDLFVAVTCPNRERLKGGQRAIALECTESQWESSRSNSPHQFTICARAFYRADDDSGAPVPRTVASLVPHGAVGATIMITPEGVCRFLEGRTFCIAAVARSPHCLKGVSHPK